MLQYSREDGIQCLALRFNGGAENDPMHIFEILCILNDAGLEAIHVPEEITDEWVENEAGDDYDQVVIPEHIKTINDKLQIGDYVIVRDGDTYVMDGELFEGIWVLSITESMDEWDWDLTSRLPYSNKAGLWRHKRDEDIVSKDGGISYFRLSERPKYREYGQLYKSSIVIGGK